MAGETLSAGEERFERGRRTAGFVLGPLAFLVVLLAPLDLEQNQHTLAAILAFVVVMWVCETMPLPVTGLVGIVLCAVLGVAPVDDVFAPFGSSTIFLFIGAFILGMAMLANGLARRFAYRILAIPQRREVDGPHDRRLRAHHLRAVGVHLELRHRRDAAADRDRDPGRGHRRDGGRPEAAQHAGVDRPAAHARLRRERRRPAHPGGQPPEHHRPRAHRGGDRHPDLLPGVGRHGAARSAR